MATRKQRAARHARRVQAGRVVQERRRMALDSVPAIVSSAALAEHMRSQGFQRDHTGKWQPIMPARIGTIKGKNGPVMKAVMEARKLKAKRRRK